MDSKRNLSFLGVAGEGIDERESSKFEEGLIVFHGKVVELKYLRGVRDAGTQVRNTRTQ